MNAAFTENSVIDTELIILENIYDSAGLEAPLRQRDLAQIAGASLGMTNSILKRLARKGWISIKKINNRNIQYLVTMDGIDEIIHRGYRYFKRTIRNVMFFKDTLESLLYKASQRNVNSVVLVGASDLDFIIEHVCRQWQLSFRKISEHEKTEQIMNSGVFIIFAEDFQESIHNAAIYTREESESAEKLKLGAIDGQNVFYLSSLIRSHAAARN